MNKNNVFGVGILVIILMIVGGLIFKVFVLDKDKSEDGTVKQQPQREYKLEKEGYEFEAEYEEKNTWEYEIKGEKPTPCHEVKHEAIVAESYPEQVTVNLSIISPSPDTVCVQATEDFKVEGTFYAGPTAEVYFAVSNK